MNQHFNVNPPSRQKPTRAGFLKAWDIYSSPSEYKCTSSKQPTSSILCKWLGICVPFEWRTNCWHTKLLIVESLWNSTYKEQVRNGEWFEESFQRREPNTKKGSQPQNDGIILWSCRPICATVWLRNMGINKGHATESWAFPLSMCVFCDGVVYLVGRQWQLDLLFL